ncbi:hypothetical protein [Burkholderia pseudomallei]|uniref:hypothetical protein n=1 Tax=Burkholderia pseudomallei TaxID=28450 RepID=UPI000538EE46|nr:hypothetical protein [Burkholderia pseudomallei]KGW92067.1 hypothetical protein Y048_4549 [Burkholderia pseudomallei MSHR456]
MDATNVSSLKAAFSAASSYSEWATLIVVGGVVVEFIALLLFSKEMNKWERVLLFIGNVLVVGGVGGEYIFSARATAAATKLQQISDERIAELGREQAADHKVATEAAKYAASLGVSVKGLRNFVADQETRNNNVVAELKRNTTGLQKARDEALAAAEVTKKDLADMTHLLSEERDVRQKMLAVITPRDLTPVEQEIMIRKLAVFSPARVDIITFGDTKEIADFGGKLANTLNLAGWRPKLWSAFSGASYGVVGIPIFIRKGAPTEADNAASALVHALTDDNVSAQKFAPFEGENLPIGGVNGPPWDSRDVADIRIYIGSKP